MTGRCSGPGMVPKLAQRFHLLSKSQLSDETAVNGRPALDYRVDT